MAKANLRQYNAQAKLSMVFAVASFLSLCALVYLLQRRYNFEMKQFIYGTASKYAPAVYLTTAVTMLLAAAAAAIGGNSAGQKRNDKTRLSWTAFFIGAVVLAVTIIAFAMFYMNRFPQAFQA